MVDAVHTRLQHMRRHHIAGDLSAHTAVRLGREGKAQRRSNNTAIIPQFLHSLPTYLLDRLPNESSLGHV